MKMQQYDRARTGNNPNALLIFNPKQKKFQGL